jgi:alkyl hydroperoxide reductase subunit D
MTLDELRESIPDYARDIRLNLSSVLTPQGAPGLTERQIASVALATAIASRNDELVAALEHWAQPQLEAAGVNGARTAAALMGMNNIYYRFVHLVGDEEYARLPARLRMNAIGNPGIDKLDFELLSLAVSAINGCGMCIAAHERKLREGGVTREAVQSAVRIAAVVHAAALTLAAARPRTRDYPQAA